ncbi:hypothetical protein [Nocardia gipuzkoensis]
MSDLAEWNANSKRSSPKYAEAQPNSGKRSRPCGEDRRYPDSLEVDAHGTITDLRITPGAMRWTNTQLAKAITETHRRARADATTKTD